MTEAMSEQERFAMNPLRLLRCGVELGKMGVASLVRKVDDAMDIDFGDIDIHAPLEVDGPYATEEELILPPLY